MIREIGREFVTFEFVTFEVVTFVPPMIEIGCFRGSVLARISSTEKLLDWKIETGFMKLASQNQRLTFRFRNFSVLKLLPNL